MKLEKREITLNEYDSIQDVLLLEKNIICAYVNALECVQRKEIRSCLCTHLQAVAKEIFLVKDQLLGIEEKLI